MSAGPAPQAGPDVVPTRRKSVHLKGVGARKTATRAAGDAGGGMTLTGTARVQGTQPGILVFLLQI